MTARLTPDERRQRAITEKQWQGTVLSLARFNRWDLTYHAPDNRPVTSASGRKYVQNVRAGFPDLVLVRGTRLVFAELKTQLGPVRPEQLDWLQALAATGAEAYLWRPSDQRTVELVLGPDS